MRYNVLIIVLVTGFCITRLFAPVSFLCYDDLTVPVASDLMDRHEIGIHLSI